jgi:hypothetical protein
MNEREFLHDLMNYITIIDGNIKRAQRILSVPETKADPKTQESLEKANVALFRMVDKIKERRSHLIALDEANSKGSAGS